MITDDVTARVWPLNVRTGDGVVVEEGADGSGGSAGKIDRLKSLPAVKRTREDGKNRRAVTVLRCGLQKTGGAEETDAERMHTEPS